MEGIVPSSGWDATQGGLTLRRALKEARGSDPRLPGLTAWHADLSHMWGATPCIKIGFASRLDLANKLPSSSSSCETPATSSPSTRSQLSRQDGKWLNGAFLMRRRPPREQTSKLRV